ncbi:hypothetical protein BpHYR1_014911 [Brachionus plicatilis]|uniref:ZP domain-containing protein n=1 Tax=Brachionus plicatilis TaxID=10195 RepID=A0A3M7R912_BRAPC|nr:hypothetical protein BpHYR1_014911 [Brachionus plicatilis]
MFLILIFFLSSIAINDGQLILNDVGIQSSNIFEVKICEGSVETSLGSNSGLDSFVSKWKQSEFERLCEFECESQICEKGIHQKFAPRHFRRIPHHRGKRQSIFIQNSNITGSNIFNIQVCNDPGMKPFGDEISSILSKHKQEKLYPEFCRYKKSLNLCQC